MTDLTLLYGAIDRVDCAITALGSVMIERDDKPESEHWREVTAIRGLYEMLRRPAVPHGQPAP